MKLEEFNRLVLLIANRIKKALQCSDPVVINGSSKIRLIITADHVIKTQTEIINDLCEKVDKLRAENLNLRAAAIWAITPSCVPMGRIVNG